MRTQWLEIAGLQTIAVGSQDAGTVVVLLHGLNMTATDLEPFAHSLRLPALYLFPQGPLPATPSGRAWFAMDEEARRLAKLRGPRDLVDKQYPQLPAAREQLQSYLRTVRTRFQPRSLILGGFSQGGMLSCDAVLNEAAVDGLILLSASRLNYADWQSRQDRLRSLPILVSHGEHDADLAFAAGLGLRDFACAAGAAVTWVPFDGGHEIPLVVWRAVRSFLRSYTSV